MTRTDVRYKIIVLNTRIFQKNGGRMQTNLYESKYHVLIRIQKDEVKKYCIYNLITRKPKKDIELINNNKKTISEKSIIEQCIPLMQDLDKRFDPSTKKYVSYPVEDYRSKLVHIFKNVLNKEGFSLRKNQVKVSLLMFNSSMQGNIALCEAEVGTGKTHAYLAASLLYRKYNTIEDSFKFFENEEDSNVFYNCRKPILISTSSIALQKAIIKDYLPQLSNLLLKEPYDYLLNNRLIDTKLSAVIRKGKEHYICDKRLAEVHAKNIFSPQEIKQLIELNYKDIDLDELQYIRSDIREKIKVPLSCNSKCDVARHCRYRKFLSYVKGKQHNFQICNHNYFLADIKKRNFRLPPLLPNYSVVVIDEAHKLEEVARQMYGSEIQKKEVKALVDLSIKSLKNHPEIDKIISITNRILKTNDNLFEELLKNIVIPRDCKDEDEIMRFKTNISNEMLKNIGQISNVLSEIKNILDMQDTMGNNKKNANSELSFKVSELILKFNNFVHNFDNIIFWIENIKFENKTKLCCIPKNLDLQLHKDLFSKGVPIVLTSGTLSVGGDFSFLKNRLGVNKQKCENIHEISVSSPFDYKNNCLLYINDNMPFPYYKDDRYINTITHEIKELIKATDGRAMVLFTSYQVLNLVYNNLMDIGNQYTLLKNTRSDITIIDKFKKSYKPVLFATGSCWEGIDIPGDVLSSLIIVKLPFPIPDPILEYKRSLYESQDEFFDKVLYPEMIIKLKQGFGRLIRNENDTGVVSILDSRLNIDARGFREKVLGCLPSCKVVNSINEVEKFIKEKKDKSYFNKVSSF